MEKDIVDGKIGDFGSYDLEFKGGKLVFVTKVEWSGIFAEVQTGLAAEALGAALKKAIPGAVDDAIIDVIVLALKSIP